MKIVLYLCEDSGIDIFQAAICLIQNRRTILCICVKTEIRLQVFPDHLNDGIAMLRMHFHLQSAKRCRRILFLGAKR